MSLAINPGSAATLIEYSKVTKYCYLSDSFIFHPFAVETSGVIGPTSLNFIRDIGRMAVRERQEPRECEWLLQRISLAIIRRNAQSILSAGVFRLDRVKWVFSQIVFLI